MKTVEANRNAPIVLSASDLSLTYPAHSGSKAFTAVEGVSFELPRGQVLAILGESGSGKSTLARVIAARGDDPADRSARAKVTSGSVRALEVEIASLKRRTKHQLTAHIGYLAQNAGATLPPDINVGDMLLEPIYERTKDIDIDAISNDIAEMMQIVDLPLTKLEEYAHELSKGQRQRVAVIRALMLAPVVVIADEPTLGVDANNRPKIVELLTWYRQRTGASMVLVTHDIGLLEKLTDEVIVMQSGRMVGQGHINDIFRDTDHRYVQQLAQALRATAYDEVADS